MIKVKVCNKTLSSIALLMECRYLYEVSNLIPSKPMYYRRRYYRYRRHSLASDLVIAPFVILGGAFDLIVGGLFGLGLMLSEKSHNESRMLREKIVDAPVVVDEPRVSPNIFNDYSDALKYGNPLSPHAKSRIASQVIGLSEKAAEVKRMELFVQYSRLNNDEQQSL